MVKNTKRIAFTSLSASVQLLEAKRIGRCLCVVLLILGVSGTAVASPDESVTAKREMDKAMYERCFMSDMNSSGEAVACTDWFVKSACDGVYFDNRGDVESFVEQENFVSYLKAAEKRVKADKKCDAMGTRRLIMSAIERDKDASEAVQIERWKYILSGMKTMIPEQQQYICGVVVEDSRFDALFKDKITRQQLGMCMTSLEATNVSMASKVAVIARFESSAPELLNENARALMAIDDIQYQRYKTAQSRLELLDLSKVSESIRSILVNRAAPLGEAIFKHWTIDGMHIWRPGFETQNTANSDRLLALWEALLNENPACSGWYAELEASILIPRGEFGRVAARAAQLMGSDSGKLSTVSYIRKLIALSSEAHQTNLLKLLALEFAKLDGNARSSVQDLFGKSLAEALLTAIEIEIQAASEKGKFGKNDISSRSEAALKALLKLTNEPTISAVRVLLGRVLAYRGDNTEAHKIWYEAIKSEDSASANEAWFLLITHLRKLGKKAEADAQYKAFEEHYPGSTWFNRLK